jgi:hypothetical protein
VIESVSLHLGDVMAIETVLMEQMNSIAPIDLDVDLIDSVVPMDLDASQKDGSVMEKQNVEMDLMRCPALKRVSLRIFSPLTINILPLCPDHSFFYDILLFNHCFIFHDDSHFNFISLRNDHFISFSCS